MPKLEWDRIFETCIKQGQNAIVTVNSPLLVRGNWGLRAGWHSAFTSADISEMTLEIMSRGGAIVKFAGHIQFDVNYGHAFRVQIAVFGYPLPSALFLTHVPLESTANWNNERRWQPTGPALPWERLFKACKDRSSDVVLVPGCPALLWSPWGVSAFTTPALSMTEIESMIADLATTVVPSDGSSGFELFQFTSLVAQNFDLAVFDRQFPRLVVVMPVPPDVQGDRVREIAEDKTRDGDTHRAE